MREGKYKTNSADPGSLYEEAIKACGKVYTSNLLWDKYIEFEKSRKKHELVGALFWRLMTFPTCKLFEYFNRFKNWIESPGRKMEHYGARLPPYPEATEIDITDPGKGYLAHDIKLDMLFSARCEQVKHRRIQEIIQQYEGTNIENNKRRGFEAAIKRAFFHAKELEEEQLQNWRDYLEFEESQGDEMRIILLYERCIVATCYYVEFWVRYATYIQRVHGVDAARGIYNRANTHFLAKRPDLFLAQGHFEEQLRNFDEARRLYKHACETVAHGLLEGLMSLLNLERRQGNIDEVERLYSKVLKIADESAETALIAFVYAKYAKFQYEFFRRKEKCMQLFEETLPRVRDRKFFYLASIEALSLLDDHKERLVKTRNIFKLALAEDSQVTIMQLSAQEKREMWEAYLIFLRDKWENLAECEAEEKVFKKLYYHAPILSTNLTHLEGVSKGVKRSSESVDPGPEKRSKPS